MNLLERDEPRRVLDDLLSSASNGGRIALISGEAGVGKSALAASFAGRAGLRARVLWGACDPLATPRSMGPLHDIGRQTGGALAAKLASGSSRESVFAALLDALDGPRQRPCPVLIVEDVHWADEATLDLLMFLGRRLQRVRMLVVVTFRDDELGPDHPLPATLATLPREVVRRIPLEPLSAGGVAQLARRAGRDAAGVHEVTGGNPLLVSEVLATTETGVPATVSDLMLARLQRLGEPAREAAHLVSIVPGSTRSAWVGGMADAVDECLAGGVLVNAGGAIAFRHELLRRAVEESLSPVRRAELHATMLSTLEGSGEGSPGNGDDIARLAHHAEHAGDVAALLRYAPIAAERAVAAHANRAAVALLRPVLPHVGRMPAVARAELLESFGRLAFLAGAAAEGLPALQQALLVREDLGVAEDIGETLRWISRLSWWTGLRDDARVNAMRAIEVLSKQAPTPQLAMAYANRALLHFHGAEPDQAIEWAERARAVAKGLGSPAADIHALITIASVKLQFRGGPATELVRVHELAAQAGLVDDATRALADLASVLMERGDFAQAAAHLERAVAYAREHDLHDFTRYLIGERATVRLEQGDWTGASADAEQSLDWAGPNVGALVTLGRLQSRRGDPDALLTLDRAAELAADAEGLRSAGLVAAARSEHFWLDGDLARAADEAEHQLTPVLMDKYPWIAGALAWRLWCADPINPLLRQIHRIDTPHRLMISGDWANAAAEWEARGARFARAEALVCGDELAAAEALRIVEELGAARVGQRWRANLRDRGIRTARRPRATAVSNAAGLTPRQVDVLMLVAEGLTNAQVGERLSMSPKTAAHHVSALLDKLAATTRGQAVAAAHRRGLLSSAQ